MYRKQKILVVIPARGGSKRLPHKNIKLLNGKPLIAYAIGAAKKSRYADRVIVSTDSKRIAKVAQIHGADVPFMRPADLATDTARAVDVVKHAIRFCDAHKFYADIVVLVNPTNPLVLAQDIDGAIECMVKSHSDACVGASPVSQRPEWMYQLNARGNASPFIRKGNSLGKRSQDLSALYVLNGSVYAMRRETALKKDSIHGLNPGIFIMPRERSVDIDERIDFEIAGALLRVLGKRKSSR